MVAGLVLVSGTASDCGAEGNNENGFIGVVSDIVFKFERVVLVI